LLLGGTVGLFGLMILARKETVFVFNRVDICVLLLMAIMTLSTITHDYTFLDNLPASRLLFFNLLPLSLYFVMRNSRLDDTHLKMVAMGLVGLGVYLSVTALFETRGLGGLVFPRYIMDPDYAEFLGRGRGPFLNPVSNGIFQVIGLSSLWMWWPNASTRGRAIILCLAVLMCAGIYSTFTRSVWLGLIVAAGLVVFLPAPRQSKGAMVVAATLVGIMLFPVIGEKILSFKRDKNVTVTEMQKSATLRPLFFTVATRMLADRPLLGCGYGQYAREKYPYLQDPTSEQPLSATKGYFQHNVFLAIASELGIVGLGALLIMFAMFVRVGILTWTDPAMPFWRQRFGMLLLVFLSNYAINGMFHEVSIIPMSNMLMYFLAAITNNVYSRHHNAMELHGLRDSWYASPEEANLRRPSPQLQPVPLQRRTATTVATAQTK
jgi:O-antigen ligase